MYYCASEFNIDKDIRDSPRYTLIKANLNSIGSNSIGNNDQDNLYYL